MKGKQGMISCLSFILFFNITKINFDSYIVEHTSYYDYFNKTTEDAKGFIKDPHDLSLALEALVYRENTIRSLISSLNESIQ